METNIQQQNPLFLFSEWLKGRYDLFQLCFDSRNKVLIQWNHYNQQWVADIPENNSVILPPESKDFISRYGGRYIYIQENLDHVWNNSFWSTYILFAVDIVTKQYTLLRVDCLPHLYKMLGTDDFIRVRHDCTEEMLMNQF